MERGRKSIQIASPVPLLSPLPQGIDLLHKSLKPLPNPPLKGEEVRYNPPVSGGLRGVYSTFARSLMTTTCLKRGEKIPVPPFFTLARGIE
jgi:hypothetical protein